MLIEIPPPFELTLRVNCFNGNTTSASLFFIAYTELKVFTFSNDSHLLKIQDSFFYVKSHL